MGSKHFRFLIAKGVPLCKRQPHIRERRDGSPRVATPNHPLSSSGVRLLGFHPSSCFHPSALRSALSLFLCLSFSLSLLSYPRARLASAGSVPEADTIFFVPDGTASPSRAERPNNDSGRRPGFFFFSLLRPFKIVPRDKVTVISFAIWE